MHECLQTSERNYSPSLASVATQYVSMQGPSHAEDLHMTY